MAEIEPETVDYELAYSNEKNGRKYDWKIVVIEDMINITIIDKTNSVIDDKNNLTYTKKYYKKDLHEKNESFLLFNEMTSLALELEERLKNNTYDLYDNINDLTISFKKDDDKKQIKQFDIRVPIRENKDNNILFFKLFSYIKALDEKVKLLEKENQEIRVRKSRN